MDLARFIQLGQIRVGLPSGEDIWLTLEEGLNLIYGKNGSGKSNTIRAIAKVLSPKLADDSTTDVSGQGSEAHPLVTAYYETDGVATYWSLTQLQDEFSTFFDTLDVSVEPTNDEPITAPVALVSFFKRSGNAAQDNSEPTLIDAFDEWLETLDEGQRSANIELLQILRQTLELHGHGSFTLFNDLKLLFEQLRVGLVQLFSGKWSLVDSDFANEVLEYFGLETRVDETLFADKSFESSSWPGLIELYLLNLSLEYFFLFEEPNSKWGFAGGIAGDLTLGDALPQIRDVATTVLGAFENQKHCPTFWVEPTNRRDGSCQMGLALGRSTESVVASHIVELTQRSISQYDDIVAIYESRLDMDNEGPEGVIFDATVSFLSNEIVSTRMEFEMNPDERTAQFESYRSNPRYLNLYRTGVFLIDRQPIQIVNLDEKIELDLIAKRTFFRLVLGHLKEATFLKEGFHETSNIVFDQDALDEIRNFTQSVSRLLSSLDIGIQRCEFQYSESLADWTLGHGASFVFFTNSSVDGRGIPLESLSSGQQYWVNAAFQISSAEQNGRGYLLLADEPERGLHERAATAAFSALAGLKATSLIATHSVSALRFSGARLMHFERDDEGKIQVAEPQLGDDVASAAQRFGTTTFDLFSLKRALVVVEGAHDVEIVRHLAACSPNPQLLDRLLIVPARGVKNVATVADSVVITEFTNLHILTIIDNGRTAALQAVVDRATAALQEGKSTQQAIKESGIRELAKDSSFEERSILDLVERAIHRRILGRLHLLALSVPDIVDLLPEASFGLKRSWSELRREYVKSGHRDGFKSWLKLEYDVSISSKTVSKAIQQLDVIDGDLHRISSELEIVASLSPLDFQN
jgi:ABC-type Mn2+/Zn2+ transport system ATPase subunit